jgi:WhiB family redox-sensing transcriptional regulator
MSDRIGSWVKDARCADENNQEIADSFQESLRGDNQSRAKLICVECPVRLKCLQWALEHQEIWGVWGGLDEGELRRVLSVDANAKIIDRCRAPNCPSCKARPSALQLVVAGKTVRVRCEECKFEWRSPTSVIAVRRYWKRRHQLERKKTQLRARMVTGKLPAKDTRATVTSIYPTGPAAEAPTGPPAALVASIKQNR